MLFPRRTRSLNAAFFVLVVALFSNVSSGAELAPGDKPAPQKSAAKAARKHVKLPGLVIDVQERCVDIEATVCLEEGMLELVACTKGSKEHESIVAITARPMHVHTALLLLLGANNGNPAMRRPIDEQQTRWVNIPPRGDPVRVYLVFENANGKRVEHPIGAFVARAERSEGGFGADAKFPGTFLFAGSLLHGDGPGPRQYLADQSGNVISIVTFGDELLCLACTATATIH